ncbi:MAG TPA: alpha-hydroxy acid oxidase, partial [Thermomicrobiales bacterium]|nr:alpha-hydroxy acid oxidase [Thermomicrobiales bacterium]
MDERAALSPVNLLEYEAAARAVVPKGLFDFIVGGAEDEVSLRENRAAFGRWRLIPRVMRGVAEPTTATTVLGEPVSLPVLISPMGLHRLAHEEGECATAAAAKAAGTIFCLSCAASCRIEDVAARTGAWWFQIYLMDDRGLTLDLVRQAEAAGAAAISLTVDVPVRGRREADERNRFALPPGTTMPNLLSRVGTADVENYAALAKWDAAITWADLDWLASATRLPVVVKGVLAAEDARLAVEHGAKGIQVSNHGGRQLDSTVGALDALPAVVEAVDGAAEVVLDGGVRRGTDVLKALALGARAVLIGR